MKPHEMPSSSQRRVIADAYIVVRNGAGNGESDLTLMVGNWDYGIDPRGGCNT